MIRKIMTIGAYGFDEKSFFQALQDAHIDTFCDIRARRGMRGSAYAFANSARLQEKLAELHIRYLHLKQLAPSEEIRGFQKGEDQQAKIAKRKRSRLGEAFQIAYQQHCLQSLSVEELLQQMPEEAAIIGLFCVEREPEACHRSLVAAWLAHQRDVTVEHILP